MLKWPFFVNLSRAALKPFRLVELITFGGKTFQQMSFNYDKCKVMDIGKNNCEHSVWA